MEKPTRPASILRTFILTICLALSACNAPMPTSLPAQTIVSTPNQAEGSKTPAPTVGVTFTPIGMTATPGAAGGSITPTHAADCDRIQYIADVTYPDDADVTAKQVITKTWRVRNVGSCAWDPTYKLVFVRGEQMNGLSPAEVITSLVAPQSNVELSIELTAPDVNGVHWGVWQVVNGAGEPVKKADGTLQELSILINVKNGTGGRVTAVRTSAYTFVGVKCTNAVEYDMTMIIFADGPLGVGYTWSVSNGVLSVVSQNTVFSAAGNVEVTTQISPPFADPTNVRVTLTANGVSNSYTICP